MYFAFLMLDIFVKYNYESNCYRVISKSIPGVLLLLYYIYNCSVINARKYNYMIIALIMFTLGGAVFIFKGKLTLGVAMLFYMLAKLFYAFKFSNDKEYNTSQIIPLLIVAFLYLIFIVNLVYDKLGYFFVPVAVYLFVILIVFFFAYLRKESVVYKSFLCVFLGVVLSIVSDSLKLLQQFHEMEIPFEKFFSIFIFGVSQYLIVMGITHEKLKDT